MSHRFLTSVGGLAVVIAVMSLPAAPVAGQAQTAAAKTTAAARTTDARSTDWTPPRTPWGDQDLQGLWNNSTSTPLQRPSQFGEQEFFTDEEAAEFAEERASELNRDRRDGGPEADINRTYNEHWMDPRRVKLTPDKRTALIVDPPDGRIPPLVALTPEAEKRRAARAAAGRRFAEGMPHSYVDASLPFRCIIRTDRPPYLSTSYSNTYQIFQSPGYVVILVEMIHSARVIPVDGRPHLGKNIDQWLGDTRGRWEGTTLVIETTNFRADDGVTYANADPETYRITERFTRADANTLNYEFTVSDPKTWTRPWTARIPWTKTDDEQVFEYACYEDNYDMVHLLAGGRAREKAADEAAKRGSTK